MIKTSIVCWINFDILLVTSFFVYNIFVHHVDSNSLQGILFVIDKISLAIQKQIYSN